MKADQMPLLKLKEAQRYSNLSRAELLLANSGTIEFHAISD